MMNDFPTPRPLSARTCKWIVEKTEMLLFRFYVCELKSSINATPLLLLSRSVPHPLYIYNKVPTPNRVVFISPFPVAAVLFLSLFQSGHWRFWLFVPFSLNQWPARSPNHPVFCLSLSCICTRVITPLLQGRLLPMCEFRVRLRRLDQLHHGRERRALVRVLHQRDEPGVDGQLRVDLYVLCVVWVQLP